MGRTSHETFDIIAMSTIVLSIFLLIIGASFKAINPKTKETKKVGIHVRKPTLIIFIA